MGSLDDRSSCADALAKRFDAYCRSVLAYASFNLARDATHLLLREMPEGISLKDHPSDPGDMPGEDHLRVYGRGFSVDLDSEEFAAVFSALRENGRAILILNEVLGVPLKEVAAILGLTYKSVRAIKSKAIRELRKKVRHGKAKK